MSKLSHRPETTTTLRKEEVSLAVGFAIKDGGGAPGALEDGEEISLAAAAAAAAALPLISPEDESSSSSSAKCSSERH